MKAILINIPKWVLFIVGLTMGMEVMATNNSVPINRTITTIHTYETYAVIRYSPSYTNSLSCPGTYNINAAVIDWSTSKDNKGLLSAALAAKLLGSNVGLGIKDTPCHVWGGGVPVLYRIDSY